MNPKTNLSIGILLVFLGMPVSVPAASSTSYNVHLQNSFQQTDPSTLTIGYAPAGGAFVDQFSLVAAIDTAGASLSAAPILGFANGGNVTFPTGPSFSPSVPTGNGYNKYQWGAGWTTQAALNAQYGTGTFTLTLGNATVQPTLSLNTVNPTYPVSPMLTGGGTWSGGILYVDPTVTTVLTFNSSAFTDYAAATGSSTSAAQIKLEFVDANLAAIFSPSVSRNGLGANDPALTSYTITPGTLTAGQTYNFQANYTAYDMVNNTPFTGTGISGTPQGTAGYLTSTFITVEALPEPSSAVLLFSSGALLLLKRRRHPHIEHSGGGAEHVRGGWLH